MNTKVPTPLLGGLSPEVFMRRYWQKKPLLIRGAIPDFVPLLDRRALLDLAAQQGVESRLVVQPRPGGDAPWRFRHGPFTRSMLPPFKQGGWTLLVQGVDLHLERAHALLAQFRFVPDARLDDLMVSYATDGGGVGPHFDSYDVFLLQASGQRRWRIGPQKNLSLVPGAPLKILAHFEPEQEFVLNPGDMLYLPPKYAHDGVAQGECMTYSVGFRSPGKAELAREMLQRMAEQLFDAPETSRYRDPRQPAVAQSGAIPAPLAAFAQKALLETLGDTAAMQRALGEYLTEPKAQVWFDGQGEFSVGDVSLDRRTRMMYDEHHVFINGESFESAGRDARLMRTLADDRVLGIKGCRQLSGSAQEVVARWCEAGWVHVGAR